MADSLVVQHEAVVRAADEHLELERELRHRDRLVLIGRISANVAHEMGTPLNVIDGRAAQLLQRPDSPVEMRQRNLTIIREQSRRIAQVVRQLLDLARTNGISRKPVDLSQVFSDVRELIEVEADRQRVIIEIVAETPVCVEGDKDMLRQVFLNLCLNAIQAMPYGGRLHLECDLDGPTKNNREFIVASVSDSGGGIAPEHLTQIFDPFFTTKDVGQGTGLGLAVSRRIVEDHGGWITAANNTVEKGAVFTIFLPKGQEHQNESDEQVIAVVEQEVQ
jgi:signal transduction histidine kinase